MANPVDVGLPADAIDRVRALPQVISGAVPWSQAERWLRGIVRIDPERTTMHINRAAGIGGSEIASILRLPHAYSTPEIVASQKLLKSLPYRPTAAMLRGLIIEDHIRGLFEADSEGDVYEEATDEERKKHLSGMIETFFSSEMNSRFGAGGWRPRPDIEESLRRSSSGTQMPEWLIGNPDRVYEVKIDGVSHLVVVDFKAPSEKTMASIKADPGKLAPWRSQVHHYGTIMDMKGFPPTALVLAVFDYANAGVAPFLMDESSPSPEVRSLILAAGQRFWDTHVLDGVPVQPSASLEKVVPPPEIIAAGVQASHLAFLKEAVEHRLVESQTPIRKWLADHPSARSGVPLMAENGTKLWAPRANTRFDGERALLRLIDAGHLTPEETLALREAPEPMSPTDPRYPVMMAALGSVIGEARNALNSLPSETKNSPELLIVLERLSQAEALALPRLPGKVINDLVKAELLKFGEPLSLYETANVTLARPRAAKDIEKLAEFRAQTSGWLETVLPSSVSRSVTPALTATLASTLETEVTHPAPERRDFRRPSLSAQP